MRYGLLPALALAGVLAAAGFAAPASAGPVGSPLAQLAGAVDEASASAVRDAYNRHYRHRKFRRHLRHKLRRHFRRHFRHARPHYRKRHYSRKRHYYKKRRYYGRHYRKHYYRRHHYGY
jgi:DNA repair photolyase